LRLHQGRTAEAGVRSAGAMRPRGAPGHQSSIPKLDFGLSTSAILIDLDGLPEPVGIAVNSGAPARRRTLEELHDGHPSLGMAFFSVAYPAIRCIASTGDCSGR